MLKNIKSHSIEGHSPLPDEVYIEKSPIHGMGIFTKVDIVKGHEFGVSQVADKRFDNGYIRTPLGGFINHSYEPNAELYDDDDTIRMRAIKDISKDTEITVNYAPYYSEEILATYK